MKVIIKEAGGQPIDINITNDLLTLQSFVGGYIETIGIRDDIVLICNEDGKRLGLPRNIKLIDINGNILDVICGTVIAAGVDDDDFSSLTDIQIHFLKEWLKERGI